MAALFSKLEYLISNYLLCRRLRTCKATWKCESYMWSVSQK